MKIKSGGHWRKGRSYGVVLSPGFSPSSVVFLSRALMVTTNVIYAALNSLRRPIFLRISLTSMSLLGGPFTSPKRKSEYSVKNVDSGTTEGLELQNWFTWEGLLAVIHHYPYVPAAGRDMVGWSERRTETHPYVPAAGRDMVGETHRDASDSLLRINQFVVQSWQCSWFVYIVLTFANAFS